MKLQVTIKSVYGNELIYPADDTARKFTELLKQKTLLPRDIKLIKELGYQVEVVSTLKELL